MHAPRTFTTAAVATLGVATALSAAELTAPSGSLMARLVAHAPPQASTGDPHALRDGSLFAIAPPKTRTFTKHDLIQVIVREQSRAESTHELETEKDYSIDGRVNAWPEFLGGLSADLHALDVELGKDFSGEGDYKREDDFTARLTAEVIDLLPNGNLVLEARTSIHTDEEESMILVTGICRPEDVDASNSVLSSRVHDLKIQKMHEGELKRSNEKGIIARILDTIFAW
jgi:flagellar L-ring protein precursor FlgH